MWKIFQKGNVGSQTLMGIPYVRELRDDADFRDVSLVWPFETGFTLECVPAVGPFLLHVEISPTLVEGRLDHSLPFKDQQQVRAWVEWAYELDQEGNLSTRFGPPEGLGAEDAERCVSEEGWILGVR